MAESAESKSVNYEELIGEEEIPLLRNISEIKNLTSSILAATTSYREVQFLFVYHIIPCFNSISFQFFTLLTQNIKVKM